MATLGHPETSFKVPPGAQDGDITMAAAGRLRKPWSFGSAFTGSADPVPLKSMDHQGGIWKYMEVY
jgi:hypothetical protein